MITGTVEDLLSLGQAARSASRQLARLSAEVKNQALHNIAGLLDTNAGDCAEACLSLPDSLMARKWSTATTWRCCEQVRIATPINHKRG